MRPSLVSSLRHSLPRPAIHSRLPGASRFASSEANATVEAAQKKAKDAFASAQKTAEKLWGNARTQQTLASAQKNAGKLWETTQKVAGPTGQKIGGMLGAYKQPIFYNLSVAREVVKQLYRSELQPPNTVAAWRSAYETLYSRAANPSWWKGVFQSGEFPRLAVYALEAYGLFKIGEILGRRHLVGYKLH